MGNAYQPAVRRISRHSSQHLAERWIKPDYVSWSVSLVSLVLVLVIPDLLLVTAGFEGIVVYLRGLVELVRVTG